MLQPYLVIINHRTWIALTIAILTPYVCFMYNIDFNIDLTLISIAIIFPLVFTIRGSFRRREKALEHLSEFRSSLITLNYFFMNSASLTEEQKKEINEIFINISNTLMAHLKSNGVTTVDIDKTMQQVYDFVLARRKVMPRTALRYAIEKMPDEMKKMAMER